MNNASLAAYEAWLTSRSVDVSHIPEDKRWGPRIHVHDAVHVGWEAWQMGARHVALEQERKVKEIAALMLQLLPATGARENLVDQLRELSERPLYG